MSDNNLCAVWALAAVIVACSLIGAFYSNEIKTMECISKSTDPTIGMLCRGRIVRMQ